MCVPAPVTAVLFTFASFLPSSTKRLPDFFCFLLSFYLRAHRPANAAALRPASRGAFVSTKKIKKKPLPPRKKLSSSAGRHYDNVDFAGAAPFIAAAAAAASCAAATAAAAKLRSIQVIPGAAELGGGK